MRHPVLIRIFTNFLTNQKKFDKPFLFTYFLLCFLDKNNLIGQNIVKIQDS